MALQTSGEITLADIQAEFGGSAPIRMSEYYGAAVGVPASGEIKIATHFYGKSSQFDLIISSNSYNVNLYSVATAAGWDGSSKLNVTINSGVWVYGTNTSTPALTISGSFPAGLDVTNNGYIVGDGGNGGNGGARYNSGSSGGSGGKALAVSSSVNFWNNGTIAGGGGGGGGGGGMYQQGFNQGSSGPGGGGGRSGLSDAPGGARGNYHVINGNRPNAGNAGTSNAAGNKGNPGNYRYMHPVNEQYVNGTVSNAGNGGSWGSSGNAGGSGVSYGYQGASGGSGGSGGSCLSGNSHITWNATGTRIGAIA